MTRIAVGLGALLLAGSARAAAPVTEQINAPTRMESDRFGWATAIDGDAAVVTAPGRANSGSVFTLRRGEAGWAVSGEFGEPDSAAFNRQLGHRAALQGGLMAIGAPGLNGDRGGVYLYHAAGAVWLLDRVVVDEAPMADDRLGVALALSATTLLIGSTVDVLPVNDETVGRVRVFEYGDGWTETGLLVAGDSEGGNRFGYAVAIDGDVAVVGAPGKDSSRGVAYVFVRADGAWTQTGKLVADDRQAMDLFGAAVAVRGDTALVGAHAWMTSVGSAYVFTRRGEAWVQTQQLVAPTPVAGEVFGYGVALSDTHALVSGYGFDALAGFGSRGGAYLYARRAGGIELLAPLRTVDGVPGDYLGIGASLSEGTALLGAPFDDAKTMPAYDPTSALGSAYVVRLAQAGGEACGVAADCAGAVACCDELCAAGTACVATSGGDETSSSGEAPTTSGSGGEGPGGGAPVLELDPLSDGCGCNETGSGPARALVWVLVGLARIRRRR